MIFSSVSLKQNLNNVHTVQVVKASPMSLPMGGSHGCLPSPGGQSISHVPSDGWVPQLSSFSSHGVDFLMELSAW